MSTAEQGRPSVAPATQGAPRGPFARGSRPAGSTWGLLAALVLLATSCVHAIANDLVDAPSALLVVERAADLTDGDRRLERHLRTASAVQVTVVDADDEPDLRDVDLVVVAPSATRAAVGDRYRDVPVPVIALSHDAWGGLGLAERSADSDEQTHVLVLDPASPVVDGREGRHQFVARESAFHQVVGLAQGGVPAVAAGDDADAVVVFTFEAGALLVEGAAPARRVGVGALDGAVDRWLAPAWDLFDASVAWSLGYEVLSLERSALVVVGGEADELNASETALRSRLRRLGFDVDVVADADLEAGRGDAYDLVVMSKTVHSHDVGTKLKDTAAGVVFWEDNQQQLAMMATIDNDASGGTTWHSTGTDVYVDADALAPLAARFSGRVRLYAEPDELCWAPAGQLAGDAIGVARVGSRGDDERYVVYAYETGGRLADGSRASGRRVFFGLYDDSFRHLTLAGVRLFDATVEWAAGTDR